MKKVKRWNASYDMAPCFLEDNKASNLVWVDSTLVIDLFVLCCVEKTMHNYIIHISSRFQPGGKKGKEIGVERRNGVVNTKLVQIYICHCCQCDLIRMAWR